MVLTSLGVVALLAALLWAVLAWLEVEDMFNWPNTIALAATGGLMVFFGHIMPQKQRPGPGATPKPWGLGSLSNAPSRAN